MEKNSFLNDIKEFSKDKLNPTTTKISYANGRQFLKTSKDPEEKELEYSQESQFSNVAYCSKLTGFFVDLGPDYSIDEIIPRLFLSGDDPATSKEILDSKSITHIINLTSNVGNKFEPEIKYQKISIYDLPSVNIMEHFKSSFEFIEKALNDNEKNSILVHCNRGVSRSSTIVIGYLMQKKIFPLYHDAYNYVKSKRPKICPNHGFVKQCEILQLKINS